MAEGLTVPRINTVLVVPFSTVPKSITPGHGLNVIPSSIENSGFKISLGIASVRVTFSASDGPAFETTIVYVRVSPASTGLGLSNLTTEISADAFTGVSTVEVLLVGSGSGVVESTVAVFVMIPVAKGLTVPLTKMVVVAPLSKVPREIAPGQGLNVIPSSMEYSGFKISLGTSSVNVTLTASVGPKLVTVNV
nr:hypothetical protein [Bacillus sp. SH5-2]